MVILGGIPTKIGSCYHDCILGKGPHPLIHVKAIFLVGFKRLFLYTKWLFEIYWILKQKPTVGTGCNRILSYQGVFVLNGKSHWISYKKWRCFDWKLFPFENTKLAWVLCVDKNASSTHTRKNTPTHPHTYPPTLPPNIHILGFFPHPTPRSAAVIAVERVIEVICKLYSCKSWSKPWCPKNSPKNHHHHLGNPPTSGFGLVGVRNWEKISVHGQAPSTEKVA